MIYKIGLTVYRVIFGYGHCCTPNHTALCRLAGNIFEGNTRCPAKDA